MPVKHVCGYLGRLGVSDGDELLSDDGQHLDVDAIELIEAAPGTWLSQAAEERPHHLNINTMLHLLYRSKYWNFIRVIIQMFKILL